jgi:hypothetical protein
VQKCASPSLAVAGAALALMMPFRLLALQKPSPLLRGRNWCGNTVMSVITKMTTQATSILKSSMPASGRLKSDRHLSYASGTVPTGNLMLSILGMFDVPADRFGDSTGRLQNI